MFRNRNTLNATAFAIALRLLQPQRAQSEDRVDGKYELYAEEHGRIEVNTASILFDIGLNSRLSLRGTATYDGISGATPTGAPPPTANGPVPLIELSDTRYAGSLEATFRAGRYSVTPQISYSTESDYESIGVALNQSVDFNQKNTTLTLGAAHNFDRVLPGNSRLFTEQEKDATDVLLGATQLLGPKSLLTVNFTYGHSEGYLADPYKGFLFTDYPGGLLPEKRPETKTRQVGYVSFTQFLDALNASTELSYRIHHDSFGILAHTAGFEWFQKFGKHVVIAPSVRFHTQSAADFYFISLPGDPTLDLTGIPPAYSSDYRVSRFDSWTYGVKVLVKVSDHFSFDLAYRRYEMKGKDGFTSPSAYPNANVFTLGASAWF